MDALRWGRQRGGGVLVMEHLADYFKVFSEANRLAVLVALREGPLNVTAVVEIGRAHV